MTDTPKYFVYAFASGSGAIVAPVPDPTQSNNTLSYQQGFSIDYSLVDTDPSSLSIPLNQTNQLFNDITLAIQQLQQNGFPVFITSDMNDGTPFPYSINSCVRGPDGNNYYSLVDNNTDTPPTSKWQLFAIGEVVGDLYLNGAADTGTANAYAIAPSPSISSYAQFQVCILNPVHANTGASTIAVNGLAPVPLVTPAGAALSTGMLIPASSYVLINNGTGFTVTNPTVATTVSAFQTINIQTFTSNGTYTPTAGMLYCNIKMVGGGGGGTNGDAGAGAGGGEYAESVISAATIGASQTVTVGSAGGGGNGANGNDGGDSSVGSLMLAKGGKKATFGSFVSTGGAGGTGGTGQILIDGGAGQNGMYVVNDSTTSGNLALVGGQGGGTVLAPQGAPFVFAAFEGTGFGNPGNSGQKYGAGGGGSCGGTAGSGAPGVVIITEYCT